jgi:hypothetical protein
MVAVFFIGVLLIAGCAGSSGKEDMATGQSKVIEENVATVTATVVAVDLNTRTVTIRGPEGRVRDIKVDETVKNLPQVDVGDEVSVTYYESIAARIVETGSGEGAAIQQAVIAAKPGEKPARAVVQQATVTATVEAIDMTNRRVTLRGPEGKTVQVKVRNPDHLKRVQVGDEVAITYTEALAISVEEIGN